MAASDIEDILHMKIFLIGFVTYHTKDRIKIGYDINTNKCTQIILLSHNWFT